MARLHRLLPLLGLLLALPVAAQNTGKLAGKVTDASTGEALIGANVFLPEIERGASTDLEGGYVILGIPVGTYTVQVSFAGLETQTITGVEISSGRTRTLDVALESGTLGEVTVEYERPMIQRDAIGVARTHRPNDRPRPDRPRPARTRAADRPAIAPTRPLTSIQSGIVAGATPSVRPLPGERYAEIQEEGFLSPLDAPFSTFSVDVDRASYANARRMLTDGYLPPPDAVRVEEWVNAFEYGLEGPRDGRPFRVHTETAAAPWAPEHRLVRVALQAERIETADLPPLNLVLLADVSGSMASADKLPLLVRGMRLLVDELRPQDRVALVVYAGAAGVVLEPTADKRALRAALGRLRAGGSTAGGQGLRLAYRLAREHFDPEATNRVILATDGDFNVGESSDAAMKRLVEQERDGGVFLSVLGFGTGNLQDAKMETLADHGNGNYAYIDSIREAETVLVREMGGTLVTLAKDVKLQLDFNPARVAAYRLIGYENRRLADRDFADDRKDAGEIGAGHSVTALYEVVPAGLEPPGTVDPSRYGRPAPRPDPAPGADSDELLTVRLRYKPATGPGLFASESVRFDVPLRDAALDGRVPAVEDASEAMRWAVAVTEGALAIRGSDHAPGASVDHALALARSARGRDADGDRAEFVRLLETARALAQTDGAYDDAISRRD